MSQRTRLLSDKQISEIKKGFQRWDPRMSPMEIALVERFEYLKKEYDMKMDWDQWLIHIGVTSKIKL
tara:strand:- start:604 stop:804 length:201 start_codon:yes stop_codon:yes gene_type:complete